MAHPEEVAEKASAGETACPPWVRKSLEHRGGAGGPACVPHSQRAFSASSEAAAWKDTFTAELSALDESERVSICEVLDRVLNKGVVVAGELTVSVADVDLLYLGLQLVLTSIETARENLGNGRGGSGLGIDLGRERTNGSGRNGKGRV